jgi:hypothetical protein
VETPDLKKLSTEELVVLEAIARKARGQTVKELTDAREVTRELAHQLRGNRHSARGQGNAPRSSIDGLSMIDNALRNSIDAVSMTDAVAGS